jgi:hypothetical protein
MRIAPSWSETRACIYAGASIEGLHGGLAVTCKVFPFFEINFTFSVFITSFISAVQFNY